MDNVAMMILFGCVISTITGLNFMELHKIRKNLERRGPVVERNPAIRQSVKQLIEGDRILAYTHAGSVVHGVCYGRCDPADAELGDTFSLHR